MTPGASRPACCRPILLFAFTLGAAALQLSPALPHPVFGIILLILSVVAMRRWPSVKIPAVFVIGAAFASLVADYHLSRRLPSNLSGQSGELKVLVTGLPERDGKDWHFEAIVQSSNDFPMLQSEKVKLAWYRSDAKLQTGDLWRFQVKLREPNGVQNPGGFDSEKQALQKHWMAQGYVKNKAAINQRIGTAVSIDGMRERLSAAMAYELGMSNARFVQSLAIGDTRQLSDEDWETLRRTGITHLIAISGFHVGIVSLAASWAMFALYRLLPTLGIFMARPISMAFASIMAAWFYTVMAGFAVPTVRTALMISVFMGSRVLLRHVSVTQAVALSLAAIVVMDTLALLSPGFWLSFSGVILLILFMPKTTRQGSLLPFFRAQWICTIGLLPLTVSCFGQTTVIGPIANMLAIPWISLIVVPLALLGCLFIGLPAISTAIWQLSAYLMDLLFKCLQWAGQLTWSSVNLPEPSIAMTLLAMLGIGLLLLPKGIPGKWLGGLLLLPILWPSAELDQSGRFNIAMIDVGQGLSVLIRTENHNLLYDAGAGKPGVYSRGETVVMPALHASGVGHLDAAVISHGDNDHAGGFPAIREHFSIGSIQASEGALQGEYRRCKAGDAWVWDDVHFRYLWPESELEDSDNDRSCVLQITAGNHSALLAGDISSSVESRLIENYGAVLKSDILLAPHHGSKSSSSRAFLNLVAPDIALVSNGFQNRFGHPNPDVVSRYREQGALLVSTADNGWSELTVTGTGWSWVRRERIDEKRYWMRTVTETAFSSD
jgi:competence protein ComEC